MVQTTRNTKLKQNCIKKEWTLFQFLEEAQRTEDISEQMSFMGHRQAKETVARGKRERWHSKQRCQDIENNLKTCGYCGLLGVHPKGWACPAFGKRCYKCHKIDHFAVACRTKLKRMEDTKMDGLHSIVVPKKVGHLIINSLQKTGIFEDALHTKKRDMMKTS